MKSLVLLAALTLTAVSANATDRSTENFADHSRHGFASQAEMQNYLSVGDIVVTESKTLTAEQETALFDVQTRLNTANDLAGGITGDIISVLRDPTSLETWVTLGQKIWQVIIRNRPVLSASTQRVSVLPFEQQNWSAMENWKGPNAKTYTIAAKNLYGMTVISQTYTVAYNHGGQITGKGAFLANATVIPADVSVSWGFSLNSEVEVGQALNMGSKESPVAGVELQLKWRMESLLSTKEGRDSFFLRGDGQMMHVTGGVR